MEVIQMLKRLLLLLVSGLFVSESSFALIDGQLLVGSKSGKFKVSDTSNNVSGQEIKVAVHVDPIPLVPVAFGAFVISDTLEVDDVSDSVTGQEIGLEVMAWVPLGIAGFKPYAKLGYTVLGAYVLEDVATVVDSTPVQIDYAYKATGSHLALGLKWSPLPLVGLMLEYDIANISLDPDSVDGVAGFDTSALPSPKLESSTIMLGVEVGI